MSNLIEFNHRAKPHARKSHGCLSPREEEMVSMLKSYSNAEISEELGVSVHTVRATLRSAFLKLHANTRTEAYWNWRQLEQRALPEAA